MLGPIEVGIGGAASLSMGPVGRASSAALVMGQNGGFPVYTYSLTKGLFAGNTQKNFETVINELYILHGQL